MLFCCLKGDFHTWWQIRSLTRLSLLSTYQVKGTTERYLASHQQQPVQDYKLEQEGRFILLSIYRSLPYIRSAV